MTKFTAFFCAMACGCAAGQPSAEAPSAPPAAAPPSSDAEPTAAPSPRWAVPRETRGDLLPPMERAVTSFGAATDGRYAYVVGGYSGKPHAYSREGQSRAIMRLPLSGDAAWEQVGELPAGLQGLSAVGYQGRICHFGGSRVDNARGEPTVMHSVPTAQCLDPATSSWQGLPDLPIPRSSHEAAVIGRKVYLAGGWRIERQPENATWAEHLLVLDLDAPEDGWQSHPAPFQRRAVGVAAVGDQLIVVGGITPGTQPSARVDVFDTRSETWSRGPDFPAEAFGVAATSFNGAVYASARDGVLRKWALGDANWTDVGPLLFGRFFHQLVPAAEGLLALGGIGGMHEAGRTRQVERISLAEKGPRLSMLELEFPGEAKNRQAWFLRGEELFLFGGNNSLEQHDFEPENFMAEGWRLHLAALAWQPMPEFPVRRQTMQTTALNGYGLALGGFGHEPEPSVDGEAKSQKEGYLFDWNTLSWSEGPRLAHGRTQFGLAAYGDRLWIFGGLDYDASRPGAQAFHHVREVLSAPARKQEAFQESGAMLPGPRRAFAGAVLKGRYYLVGGMREGFQLVEDCLSFSFETKEFSELACPEQPRLSGDLVALGEKLYLVGGSVRGGDGMEDSRRIQVYDPAQNTWSDLGIEVPFETRHMRALAYRGRLLLVSTFHPERRMRLAFVDVE